MNWGMGEWIDPIMIITYLVDLDLFLQAGIGSGNSGSNSSMFPPSCGMGYKLAG